MVKGSLCASEGIVRCPWHGACFNLTTGDIEDFPGLDPLQTFAVDVENNGDVYLSGCKEQFDRKSKTKTTLKPGGTNQETVVVVGGGGAAQVCVETLRRKNDPWQGRIVMISQENCLPYDRPKLSKNMVAKGSDLQLRNSEFFTSAGIETKLGVKVTHVDDTNQTVQCSDASQVHYDHLVLATGGRPREMTSVPGCNLNNIYQLRSPEDANTIATAALGKHVVVVGSSFIG